MFYNKSFKNIGNLDKIIKYNIKNKKYEYNKK